MLIWDCRFSAHILWQACFACVAGCLVALLEALVGKRGAGGDAGNVGNDEDDNDGGGGSVKQEGGDEGEVDGLKTDKDTRTKETPEPGQQTSEAETPEEAGLQPVPSAPELDADAMDEMKTGLNEAVGGPVEGQGAGQSGLVVALAATMARGSAKY
jgi:hypothetical protein